MEKSLTINLGPTVKVGGFYCKSSISITVPLDQADTQDKRQKLLDSAEEMYAEVLEREIYIGSKINEKTVSAVQKFINTLIPSTEESDGETSDS